MDWSVDVLDWTADAGGEAGAGLDGGELFEGEGDSDSGVSRRTSDSIDQLALTFVLSNSWGPS